MWKRFILPLMFVSSNLFAMAQISLDTHFSRLTTDDGTSKTTYSSFFNSAFIAYGTPEFKVGPFYAYSEVNGDVTDQFMAVGASIGTTFFADVAVGSYRPEATNDKGWGVVVRPGYRFAFTSNVLLKGEIAAFYRQVDDVSSLSFVPALGLDIVF